MTATEATAPPQARVRPAWVIAVACQKGGVGKTTLTLGLAAVNADSSGRSLVVDIDPQGSAEEIAEAAGEGLPFDFASERDPSILAELRRAVDYDTIYVDCPGSLEGGDGPDGVLAGVLDAADLVIIPVVPERAAVKPALRTAGMAAAAGVPYRVVLNQVDPLRGAGPVESMRQALDAAGVPRMRSMVRRYVAHSQSQLEGRMITQYRGDRSARAALDDMRRVHAELLLVLDRDRQP